MTTPSVGPVKPHDPEETELAPQFTVRDYKKARDSTPPDRAVIADALYARFNNRYIEPVRAKRRGFTIMAVSCLMIEALESFRQGWESSEGRSKSAFCFFFDQFDEFTVLRGHAQEFYKHIRCGILHQAESTGGWRIRRDSSPLFDAATRTVNAERFLEALETVLKRYCNDLKALPWDSPEWKHARKKMEAIVKNC
jgi:hypothetical protein